MPRMLLVRMGLRKLLRSFAPDKEIVPFHYTQPVTGEQAELAAPAKAG